jgi:cardiolipin synthase A/B
VEPSELCRGDGASWAIVLGALALVQLLGLVSAPSVLLNRRGRPTAALAWLFALFALPGLGSLLWWALGRTRIEKRRRKSAAKRQAFVEARGTPGRAGVTLFDRLFPERAFGEGVFTSDDNEVRLLTDGPAFFSTLEATLAAARHSIYLNFYIFREDDTGQRILRLLEEKAREGVTVRLLVDGFGTGRAKSIRARLERAGGEFAVFLPSRFRPFYAPRVNFVNHRKIVVVDHEVAFTGGMNIGREYERVWRDVMIELRGPAVNALEHVFFEDWYFATDCILEDPGASGETQNGIAVATIASGPDSEPWILDAYFMLIAGAKERVWVVTPYFIPGAPMTEALRTAAGRGVDVRIVVPERSDVSVVAWASRSYYRVLVDAGVKIYEYQGPMLHAKALLIDRSLLSVGTANIDSRSFRLAFEVSCFIECPTLAAELAAWVESLWENTSPVDAQALDRKPKWVKVLESAAHLFSPIL